MSDSRIVLTIGDTKCFIERNDRGDVTIRRYDQPLIQRGSFVDVYPFDEPGAKCAPVHVTVEDE